MPWLVCLVAFHTLCSHLFTSHGCPRAPLSLAYLALLSLASLTCIVLSDFGGFFSFLFVHFSFWPTTVPPGLCLSDCLRALSHLSPLWWLSSGLEHFSLIVVHRYFIGDWPGPFVWPSVRSALPQPWRLPICSAGVAFVLLRLGVPVVRTRVPQECFRWSSQGIWADRAHWSLHRRRALS